MPSVACPKRGCKFTKVKKNCKKRGKLIRPGVGYTIKTDGGVDGRPLNVDASPDRDLLKLVLFDKIARAVVSVAVLIVKKIRRHLFNSK